MAQRGTPVLAGRCTTAYSIGWWRAQLMLEFNPNADTHTKTINHQPLSVSPRGVGRLELATGCNRCWGGLQQLCMQTLNIQSAGVWISQRASDGCAQQQKKPSRPLAVRLSQNCSSISQPSQGSHKADGWWGPSACMNLLMLQACCPFQTACLSSQS